MAVLTFPSIIPSSVSFGITYNTQINISSLSGSVQTIEVPGARWSANLSFDDLEPIEGRVLAAFLIQLRGSSGRFYLYDHSHKLPRGSNLGITVIVDASAQEVGTALDTGTALGTHSTTTIEDTTATFITDGLISDGDFVRNIANSETREILSFTETVITVTAVWTLPVDTDGYELYSASQVGNTIATSGWDANETDVLLPGDYIELEGKELKMITIAVSSDANGEAIINFDPPIRVSPSDLSSVTRTNCETIMLLDSDENSWSTNNAGLLTNFTIGCAEAF